MLDTSTEIIIADGGSTDGTLAGVTDPPRVRCLPCPRRGRAAQMNAGAGVATGDVLLFLHADTNLPEDALRAIRSAMAEPGAAGGSFCLRFDSRGPVLRLLASFTRWNSRFWTFGDQAIFVRRPAFEAIGGYPDWPLLEDVDLQRKLRRRGRFVKLPLTVTTSARRFRRYGPIRQTLRNALLLTGYYVGVSPRWLARFYQYVTPGEPVALPEGHPLPAREPA